MRVLGLGEMRAVSRIKFYPGVALQLKKITENLGQVSRSVLHGLFS